MRFKPYPKYTPSGVEWLDDVPDDWTISKLGFESWVRARLGWKGLKAEEYVDEGFAFLATPNIKGIYIDFENVNFINEVRYLESPEIRLQVGDVLLTKDGSTLGTVNVVRILPRPSTVNSSIAVITPGSALHGIYLYYLFCSAFMKHSIQRVKGGMGVPHLFQEDLNKFHIPLPSFDQQSKIANFLDSETAKIDTLIAKQEILIKLLKEKRQAVISHAVTKGLYSNVPMKDSGVEWLGDVPEHWTICSFRHCASIAEGQVDPKDERFRQVILIAPNHVESGTGRILFTETAGEQEAISGKYQVNAGDVIYSKIRPSLNKVCIAMEDCLCSADMYPIRASNDLVPNYLHALMLSAGFVKFMSEESARVAMPKVNREAVNACKIPLPSIDEQQKIVTYLEKAKIKIDILIEKAQQAIALQKEHRTALISAAVTGKIDVRGEVSERKAA